MKIAVNKLQCGQCLKFPKSGVVWRVFGGGSPDGIKEADYVQMHKLIQKNDDIYRESDWKDLSYKNPVTFYMDVETVKTSWVLEKMDRRQTSLTKDRPVCTTPFFLNNRIVVHVDYRWRNTIIFSNIKSALEERFTKHLADNAITDVETILFNKDGEMILSYRNGAIIAMDESGKVFDPTKYNY